MKSRYFIGQLLILGILCLLKQTVLASPIELSMADSIAMAWENNPAMTIAGAEQGKAVWALHQARANTGLNLSVVHTDSRYKQEEQTFFGRPYDTYNNKFDNEAVVSLPIYSGGKLGKQIDEAKDNLAVADISALAAKQQVKLNTITAYFEALEYRNQLAVSQETVDDLAAHLQNVEAQYQVGAVARMDVLYSQVQLASAQDSRIRVQNSYDNALANLNSVIGLPHDTDIELKDDFSCEKQSDTLPDCIAYALIHRPEILAAQARIAAARAEVGIAKSDYAPMINLKGIQDWYDSKMPGRLHPTWTVSLTTSFTVFDSGVIDAQVKEAQYGLDETWAQAKQTEDSTALEVRQYYHSMEEANQRIETAKLAVEQAEDNYKIAEVGYQAGLNTNVGVIDAQTALTQAKTNYIQALYDYNMSKAQLDKAMGKP